MVEFPYATSVAAKSTKALPDVSEDWFSTSVEDGIAEKGAKDTNSKVIVRRSAPVRPIAINSLRSRGAVIRLRRLRSF